MPERPDPARIVAETLAGMLTAGGVAAATAAGTPGVIVGMGTAAVGGVFKYLIAQMRGRPDPKDILRRIRDERTAYTVEAIRDALVEAMGLKPEFKEPIAELADAVQAGKDGRDEERFQKALLTLFTTVTEITATLKEVKEDTGVIREDTASLRSDVKEIKTALGIGADVSGQSAAGHQFLKVQVDSLSAQLRCVLDEEGKRRWEMISTAMAEHSWQQALELSMEMEQWLEDQGDRISVAVKIQGLLTLADVAVIRDSGFPFEDRQDTTNASRLLCKAEAAAAATSGIDEETASRLLRVRAKVTYIQGDPDTARNTINGLSDPGTISLTLGMMAEEGTWAEASDLAFAQGEPHKKWAASAVVAHVKAEHPEHAEVIIDWAKGQEALTKKSCALALVKTKYANIVGDGTGISLQSLGEADRQILEGLQAVLADSFAGAFAGGPASGIDAEALEMAILIGHVLRALDTCQDAADQLVKWQPISPELGRAVMRGDIAAVDGLADRYLDEHRALFLTQMLAAMLLVEAEGDASRALDISLPLLDTAEVTQREEVATTVLIAAQYCDVAVVQEAYRSVSKSLGGEHRLTVMLQAVLLAKEGSLDQAQSVIDALADNDDHIWLQLAASIATQQQKWADAAQLLHRLADLTGHAEAYRYEAEAWYRAEQSDRSVAPLEKAHELLPHDDTIVRNLASAYHLSGRFREAASAYDTVWQRGQRTEALALNYSNALVLSGNTAKAISTLRSHISDAGNEVTLAPLLGFAHLLHIQDDAAGALDVLLPQWDRFHADHRYLMAVMQLGYASGREVEAQKAFAKLVHMLDEGVLPKGVMWKGTLDDIRGMHEAWNERRKHVDGFYLSGRLPWLLASNWIQPSNHSYLSWLIRTQPLVPSDHPENAAEYSLYSTNAFTAINTDGHKHLAPIVTPPKGTDIVADMSALITLHRLGLLELACGYFGTVYIPQSYRLAWLEEKSRIPHHQPKQIESRQAIVDAVHENRIAVTAEVNDAVPLLDEYTEEAQGAAVVVRIRQIVGWLANNGKLSGEQRADIESRQNQPGLVSDDDATSALEGGIVVGTPLTLQTIYDVGLLGDVCRGLRVYVKATDLHEIEAELRNQRACGQTGQWYRELVSAVDSIPNISFVARGDDDEEPNDDGGQNADAADHVAMRLGIDAALLAQQTNRSLLVDDRYCQQGLLSSRPDDPQAAFGSDALVVALAAHGTLTQGELADQFLQMIRWRYKFLLPPVAALREMATRFRDGLPGDQLREVAAYVQDCMRDAGLYGGPEQVEPPTPMAMKLFKAWIDLLTAFLVETWWDERFTEEQAARLTRWAARCFLPAWPRNMPPPVWRRIAYVRRYALLGGVLTNLLQRDDARKANRVVNRVRRSIGIREEELASAAESVSESMIAVLSDQDQGVLSQILVHVLKIVYGNRPAVPWRLLPLAQRMGLVASEDTSGGVPDEHIAAFGDRNHPNRLGPVEGPFAYIIESDKHATATFLPEALCVNQASVRQVALDHLLSQELCPKTSNTQAALGHAAERIRADDVDAWVPAVSMILEQLEEDFVLNMAGFAQAQERRHDDACAKCWSRLIRPTAESLLAIDRDGWSMLPTAEGSGGELLEMLNQAETLDQLLTLYDQYAGHLTLSPPYDLGTHLRELCVRCGCGDEVWAALVPWLDDRSRPWRQYHACQSLLINTDLVPEEEQGRFWKRVLSIVELTRVDKAESDEAQVWRLEAELAANYLRTIDLGGYGLEANRPLTASWWAASRVTELLASDLLPERMAEQIGQWRSNPILRGTVLTHDAWAWLSPKAYSPIRFATLNEMTPRSIALLLALGMYARSNGVEAIPAAVRVELRDCFCTALIVGDTAVPVGESGLWMWEHSLIEAAKTFFSALPDCEQTELAAQAIGCIEGLAESTALKKALEQLATTTEADALLLCTSIRGHCYANANAGDVIKPFLRDEEWRNTCARRIPMLGWDMLAQGLLILQMRNGLDWAVEVPYVFLRLAEASHDDSVRATGFLTCLVMSSAASNTGGALKALLASERLAQLRPLARSIKARIEEIAEVADPSIRLRLQMSLTLLDQL